MQQKLFIKGMVCERCIISVRQQLSTLGFKVVDVNLGEAVINTSSEIDHAVIGEKLNALGFTILTDKRLQLMDTIKSLVAKVYSGSFDFPLRFTFSAFIAQELGLNYESVANTFTGTEQITLEKYIMRFRMEKIKEALVYTNQSLTALAFSFGFSSVAHLSKQFKRYSGLTPSHFKKIKNEKLNVMPHVSTS